MIDFNPIQKFTGRSYTTEEAAEVQQYLYEHQPTGDNWYWHDGNHNKVISTQVISGKATDSPKPVKGNERTTDPARASSEPEGKPNE